MRILIQYSQLSILIDMTLVLSKGHRICDLRIALIQCFVLLFVRVNNLVVDE